MPVRTPSTLFAVGEPAILLIILYDINWSIFFQYIFQVNPKSFQHDEMVFRINFYRPPPKKMGQIQISSLHCVFPPFSFSKSKVHRIGAGHVCCITMILSTWSATTTGYRGHGVGNLKGPFFPIQITSSHIRRWWAVGVLHHLRIKHMQRYNTIPNAPCIEYLFQNLANIYGKCKSNITRVGPDAQLLSELKDSWLQV